MPWINEFHYDNAGTDEGEFIEIAGLAGTDLTGWSLILYNGGGGLSYNTLALSGVISNQSNGFGTLSFAYPANGIQNGSPDGIALVDPSNAVIEFISYEGSFQATDGPAIGLTSVDVGVMEGGLDAVGGSIARTGTGNEASDFSWQLGAATPGLVNQTFVSPPAPDFINLQYPSSSTVEAGAASELIYGRIFEAGLTEAAGAAATVVAQLGYGPAGSDPTSPDWVWVDATFNTQVGNDDEYAASLTIPTPGSYSYTYRFAIDDGSTPLVFSYADLDGAGTNTGLSFDPSQLGSLTVNPITINGTNDPDVINGGGLAEVIAGLDGNDLLNGGGGDDQISGGSGNDLIDGGTGADELIGGTGDDRYIVDQAGDTTTELAGEGMDRVASSISWTLGSDLEILQLTGVDATNGTGNSAANTIFGNSADNVLNGGSGADSLRGGEGNDTYIVDNAGDRAVEASSAGGTDLVRSSVSFLLGTNVENLQLTGGAAIKGTGNALANIILGNTAANVLNGGAGADSLRGGAGNDTYIVDNAGDRAIETSAGGVDTVKASVSFILGSNVEKLYLIGSAAINGRGNALANTIYGNQGNNILGGMAGNDYLSAAAGNDRLYGGAGHDRLIGGAGADRFYFDSPLDALTNVDRIIDFSVADDTIVLDQTIFSALATGSLSSSAFRVGTAAADADDRIIYDGTTGRLYYDADGNGTGLKVLFATITAGLPLSNLDIVISS